MFCTGQFRLPNLQILKFTQEVKLQIDYNLTDFFSMNEVSLNSGEDKKMKLQRKIKLACVNEAQRLKEGKKGKTSSQMLKKMAPWLRCITVKQASKKNLLIILLITFRMCTLKSFSKMQNQNIFFYERKAWICHKRADQKKYMCVLLKNNEKNLKNT